MYLINKFYIFYQNNSGGTFRINDKVNEYVIIEAYGDNHANSIAEEIGIYFDGCAWDIDCRCCGDRWDRTTVNDGFDVPSLSTDEPILFEIPPNQNSNGIIYYLNGEIKHFFVK